MKLKKEYRKGGYLLTYVKHEGDIYMYTKKAFQNEEGDAMEGNIHWEVVRGREKAASKTTGVSARYAYPGDSEWGINGWTLMSRDKAEAKFNELR